MERYLLGITPLAADNFDCQPGDAFSNSTDASANLLYQFNEHITAGLEFTYGERENNDGSDISNSRVMFGLNPLCGL